MTTLTLELPYAGQSQDQVTPVEFLKEMRLAAALYRYVHAEVSASRAAEMAGLTLRAFLKALAERKIDVFAAEIDELKREKARG